MANFLIFDLDRKASIFAAEDAGLPVPTWVAENPKNQHAHIAYGLESPVCTSVKGGIKPLRYLAAIESAYAGRLGADPRFAGLITKNPLHPAWNVRFATGSFFGRLRLYGLGELAEYVDLTAPVRQPVLEESTGTGRNCALFDTVRFYAYRAVHGFRDFDAFRANVMGFAQARNTFLAPLPQAEIGSISRSVAKWTWQNRGLLAAQFSEKQAARGAKGGKAKGKAFDGKRDSARLMKAAGRSVREIAQTLGVHRDTVYAWLKVSE